uniref:Lipoprotein n=1 Tax=mine drainage metagenome TaxID=410659 RepID=E6Q2Z9_9ZZZZ
MKRIISLALAACAALALVSCGGENRYERLADRITQAMQNNSIAPVQNELAKGINIDRVRVAEAADALAPLGKIESVKEVKPCEPGVHCFIVKFQKATYREKLRLDENGKIVAWRYTPE